METESVRGLAEGLGSATTPSATEAAVAKAFALDPREHLLHRALIDVLVGVVAALQACSASAESQALGASIARHTFQSAHEGDWSSKEGVLAGLEDLLVEAVGSGELALSEEEASAVARFLSSTLFAQWQLHAALFRGSKGWGGNPPRRIAVHETRVVDAPRCPPPLSEGKADSDVTTES
jgi:hypothetical protein